MTALKAHKKESSSSRRGDHHCLSDNVRIATETYFADLDGHEASNLYELFLAQVEKPLLEVVLQKTRGNITKAAQVLGLNRATLRSRLKKYGLD